MFVHHNLSGIPLLGEEDPPSTTGFKEILPYRRSSSITKNWDPIRKKYHHKGVAIPISFNYQHADSEHALYFLAEEVEVPETSAELSPTRLITHVYKEFPDKKPADIMIFVTPGFGETSAHFETGDFYRSLISQLRCLGYENPHIVGINVMGAGTAPYMENKDKLSKVKSLPEGIRDAEKIARYVLERYQPKCGLNLVGHSMGQEIEIGIVQALTRQSLHIDRFVLVSGATPGLVDWGNPQTVWNIKDQLVGALKQWIQKSGCTELSMEDQHRMMFGGQVSKGNLRFYQAFSVPDSGRAFVDLAFSRDPSLSIGGWGAALLDHPRDMPEFHFVEATGDTLLPAYRIDRQTKVLEGAGVPYNVHHIPMTHGIPTMMNHEQIQAMWNMWGDVFKR